MASMPKFSTVISWLIYSVPIYIFVLNPLLQQVVPKPVSSLWDANYASDDWDDSAPGLNLTDDSFISPEDGVPLNCAGEPAGYKVHLLSRTPLILYIENFLSDEEADHLVDTSLNKYTPSIVYDGFTERVDPNKRLSDRALLDRDDTVRCLEDRARAFQGWRPHLYIERMWAQRYNASGHYRHHYDWTGSLARGGDRLSTFMVYLAADCEGGGTNFPRLQMPAGKQWCRFLECEDEQSEAEGGAGEGWDRATSKKDGITFKPIKGNAVFWENLRPDGTGYTETWHAAYPVTSGTKVGLNIWSWYQPPKRRR
ncbi:hypothetical protein N7532_003952 [Penicillium argentinense]|uniref:Fe2OG dioxygenase domain-containing protein n=1 Tax=Penicillium argentinense TaxID=1131581 RepID=A0A9W9KF66_9EURO|nr:uncharacterized protein N7532_003952 [Penicillium argentinense]KAJ5103423.1 hypothetical protein N7532_003952 [Penicillium argentinense]